MRKLLCIVPANYEELQAKGVDFGIQMRDLNGYWDEVFTIHPFCRTSRRRIELSNRHTVLEFKIWDLRIIPQLVKLIRRESITAIKAHDPFICGLLGLVLSKLCHVPYTVSLYTSYDLIGSLLGTKAIDKLVNRIVMNGASLVFAGTKPARRLAISMGAKEDKIRRARSANVWIGHFEEPEERERDSTVFFAGRLSPEKGVTDMVNAFSVVATSIPEAKLLIYGEGDMDISAQIAELGLADKVTLLGFQSQEQVRETLLSVGVTLIPLGGNALVEACLAQTPIVAYDLDWHPELVEHDKGALLAPFQDWHAMGEMAIRLLRDRELATRLGKEARAQAILQRHPNSLYRIEAQAFDEVERRRK